MAELTLVEAVNDALHCELARDENVMVLGEDVGRAGGVFRATAGLRDRFGPNRCFDTPAELEKGVLEIARELAAKSPLAMRGTKHAITYARDHSIADGLDQIATWNSGTLLSTDLDEALAAFRDKRPARFDN